MRLRTIHALGALSAVLASYGCTSDAPSTPDSDEVGAKKQ